MKTRKGMEVKVETKNGEVIASFNYNGIQKASVHWSDDFNGQAGLVGRFNIGNVCLTVPKDEAMVFIKRAEEERKKIEDEKYAPLEAELPAIPDFSNTPNEEKFNELMSKIDNNFFSGKEYDGLNLSISANNAKIRKEARQYCDHEIEINIKRTFTADYRNKVIRTITCKKCGLHVVDEVSEKLPDSYIWG